MRRKTSKVTLVKNQTIATTQAAQQRKSNTSFASSGAKDLGSRSFVAPKSNGSDSHVKELRDLKHSRELNEHHDDGSKPTLMNRLGFDFSNEAQSRFLLQCLMAVALLCLALNGGSDAFAASSGSTSVFPYEAWLVSLQKSFSGPVAFSLSMLGIVCSGATLIFSGGEIKGFVRSIIYLIFVITMLIGANTLMTNFFNGSSIGNSSTEQVEVDQNKLMQEFNNAMEHQQSIARSATAQEQKLNLTNALDKAKSKPTKSVFTATESSQELTEGKIAAAKQEAQLAIAKFILIELDEDVERLDKTFDLMGKNKVLAKDDLFLQSELKLLKARNLLDEAKSKIAYDHQVNLASLVNLVELIDTSSEHLVMKYELTDMPRVHRLKSPIVAYELNKQLRELTDKDSVSQASQNTDNASLEPVALNQAHDADANAKAHSKAALNHDQPTHEAAPKTSSRQSAKRHAIDLDQSDLHKALLSKSSWEVLAGAVQLFLVSKLRCS